MMTVIDDMWGASPVGAEELSLSALDFALRVIRLATPIWASCRASHPSRAPPASPGSRSSSAMPERRTPVRAIPTPSLFWLSYFKGPLETRPSI